MSAIPVSPVDTAAKSPELRKGPALIKASKPFAKEDRRRSWFELTTTMFLMGVFLSIGLFAPLWAKPIGAVFGGFFIVRTFIIFHDTQHGAMFSKAPIPKFILAVFGVFIMSPAPIWSESHDFHHKNNCKLPSTSVGSYPVVTTRMWRRMSTTERRMYRFGRSPFTIVFGYFTIFFGQMCVQSFLRNPRLHWQSALSPFVHGGTAIAVGLTLGWSAALFGVVLPLAIGSGLGSYMFYAQHNGPGVYFSPRQSWEYSEAATKSSTMFDMPGFLHYLTGNIGYHHVHHLNHRIPFYRLPEAMAGIPELQDPVRTNWWPSTVLGALRVKLWDPSKKEMVPFPTAS